MVGAAREFKDSEWRKALAQDGYPWENLIALGEDQAVWTLYGIPASAGDRFLIGPDGTICKRSAAGSGIPPERGMSRQRQGVGEANAPQNEKSQATA